MTKKSAATNREAKGILEQIEPVHLSTNGISMVLYGKSGTGKTVLASTFPKPALLIGADEDGTRSVTDVKDLFYVRISKSEELITLVEYTRTTLNYSTVIVDTTSQFYNLVLREILNVEKLPEQKAWGMVTQAQYQQCSLQVKEKLRTTLALVRYGVNVVLLAQERNFNEEQTSDIMLPSVGPALGPAVVGWMNPACDYVCQTFLKQKTMTKTGPMKGKDGKPLVTRVVVPGADFCLRTLPDAVYMSKFRAPKGTKVPEYLVDHTYTKILSLIEGGHAS